MDNPLQHEIDEIEKSKKAAEEALKQHPDVKEGKSTIEEEKQEPGFILYNQIAESMIDIMKKPEVSIGFIKIGKQLGEEMSRTFVDLIAVCTVTAAHNAIVFYDDLLKKEIKTHFDVLTNYTNNNSADIHALKSVLEVFNKRLSEIEKKLKIDEINKT